MRQCRDDETKYAATHSTQIIAVKGKLVPCETLKRNSNITGAADIKGLSREEYKMIISMRKGCREMVTQQRNQRQQQFNSNTGGYQPKYQSTNFGYGPAPQSQPGRQVTYGNNNSGNNYNGTELNYGYHM